MLASSQSQLVLSLADKIISAGNDTQALAMAEFSEQTKPLMGEIGTVASRDPQVLCSVGWFPQPLMDLYSLYCVFALMQRDSTCKDIAGPIVQNCCAVFRFRASLSSRLKAFFKASRAVSLVWQQLQDIGARRDTDAEVLQSLQVDALSRQVDLLTEAVDSNDFQQYMMPLWMR